MRYSTPERPNPGMMAKADDAMTVPLCSNCHRVQHSGRERAFWEFLRIDPFNAANALDYFSPDTRQMRGVIDLFRQMAYFKKTGCR